MMHMAMSQSVEEVPCDGDFGCHNDYAIAAVEAAAAEHTIVLDFDETLFLRNSTEEYLNSLQPRFLGALLLFTLSLLKPWKWLPEPIRGDASRDWLRVVIATVLFPWTPRLWKARSQRLAREYANPLLMSALNANPNANIIIASNGYDFIIRPLLEQLDLPVKQLIACRFWQGFADRQRGKKELLTDHLEPETLAQAIVITDSIDDAILLNSVATPCLTQWPEARYVRAMGDFYIPFFYTTRVKHAGKHYMAKVVAAEDWLFLVLATSWLSDYPLVHAAGMAFLMAAFWCIYEVGYMENDLIAEKLETSPKLSPTYLKHKSRINLWQPWFWAVLFSLPGIVLLQLAAVNWQWSAEALGNAYRQLDSRTLLLALGAWIAMLAALRVTYLVYNYTNKPTRVWLYPVLQAFKCFGFLVVASTNLIGSLLFFAHCLSRSIIYLIYRYSDGGWYRVGQVLRWQIFGSCLLAAAIGTHDISLLLSWQAWTILILTGLKARREFRPLFSERGWITDPARS
jgi:hypothetical protein